MDCLKAKLVSIDLKDRFVGRNRQFRQPIKEIILIHPVNFESVTLLSQSIMSYV